MTHHCFLSLCCGSQNLRADGEAALPAPSLCRRPHPLHPQQASSALLGHGQASGALESHREELHGPVAPTLWGPLSTLRRSGIIYLWQPVMTKHQIRPERTTFLPTALPGHADSVALSPPHIVYNGLQPTLASPLSSPSQCGPGTAHISIPRAYFKYRLWSPHQTY